MWGGKSQASNPGLVLRVHQHPEDIREPPRVTPLKPGTLLLLSRNQPGISGSGALREELGRAETKYTFLFLSRHGAMAMPSDCGSGAGGTEQQAQQVQCCRERRPLSWGAAEAELLGAAGPPPC